MRKLAIPAFAFAGGIFLAQYLLPLNWQLPLGAAFFLLGALGFLKKENTRLRIFLIAGGLAAALAYNWAYVRVVQMPAEALADTDRTAVTMTLCDYAAATDYGARVTVRLHLNGLHGVNAVYYGRSELLNLAPGWTVTDDIHFKSAAHIRDDDVTAFTSRGTFLLAYGGGDVQTSRGTSDSLRWLPAEIGHAIIRRIARMFSGDTAGFLTAILTGDKSALSDAAATDLSEAGMYHILAVSGMHCGFLLAMVMILTGRHRRRLTAGIAIPLLLFYMVLTGNSPSVVRSCIMLIFLLLAPLFHRDGDPPTAMAAALLVILLQNPFAAAAVGLQLSFAAVAGLLWVSPGLYRLLLHPGKSHGKAARVLAGSAAASLGATVFTAPLCAYYFNIFWLVSPLSNLLCLWAAGLVFGFGLSAVALSFLFSPLGTLLGLVPRVLISYILSVSHLLARIPYHAVYFSNPYLKYWLIYLYVLFGAAYLLKPPRRRKYAVAAGLAALALFATVRMGALQYIRGDLDIVALNVGQGESILLASGEKFALIDCGSGNSWYSAGDIAADQLLSMGGGELDFLMLTHYDFDHVSGVTQLLSRVNVGLLLVPDTRDDAGVREAIVSTAECNHVPVEYVTAEKTYSLGPTTMTIYPPLGTDPETDNDRGLTLLASDGAFDLLVTGDMSGKTESTLLSRYALPDIEALVVGHHGSKSSTSEELLDALRPEVAIISVGSNSYGHPAPQILQRLAKAGAAVYRTDLQGTIYLTVN